MNFHPPSSVNLFVYTLSLNYFFSSPHPHPLSIPVLYYKMQVLWFWTFMSVATMVGQKSISYTNHCTFPSLFPQFFLVYPIFSFHGPSGSAASILHNLSHFLFYTIDAINLPLSNCLMTVSSSSCTAISFQNENPIFIMGTNIR